MVQDEPNLERNTPEEEKGEQEEQEEPEKEQVLWK